MEMESAKFYHNKTQFQSLSYRTAFKKYFKYFATIASYDVPSKKFWIDKYQRQ